MIAYLAGRAPAPGPRWVRDTGTGLVLLLLGLLLMWAVPEVQIRWTTGGAAPVPASASTVLVLVVACLGMPARRTAPVAGLAVAAAAVLAGALLNGRTDLGTLLVCGDLLYCAVLYPSRRAGRAVAAASGVLVALLALVVLLTDGGRPALLVLIGLMLPIAVPVLWAIEVRRHRDLAAAERGRAEQAAVAAELDRAAAVAAERARMARDLHDIVAGQLSAIALQSEAALHRGDADPELLHRVLTSVRQGSVSALAEMRTMIGLLRAEPGTEPRTAPARLDRLGPLLDAARERGLHVEVADERPDTPEPAAAVHLAAYRILQEGLTNAAKHAPGCTVRLGMRHEGGALVLALDNELTRPTGGPPGTSGGTGLLGLRERARAVGGLLDAGPNGDRWRLTARLALTGEPAGDATADMS